MTGFLETFHADIWEVLGRMVLAAFLGFLVGLDRSIKDKPLGFRPFMLVSLGSCLFAVTILELATGALPGDLAGRIDVSRIMQGVIGGIGFLGAGAIIQSRSDGGVEGSATGAGIWMVGGIGMAVGFGLYIPAVLAAILAVIIFVVFGMLRQEVDDKTEELNGKT